MVQFKTNRQFAKLDGHKNFRERAVKKCQEMIPRKYKNARKSSRTSDFSQEFWFYKTIGFLTFE